MAQGREDGYDVTELIQPLQPNELSRENTALYHTFGMDCDRRNNLAFIEQNICLYISGNALVILDLTSMKRKYIFGIDGRGIGAFCVHPSREFIAVGAKGNDPKIYIYTYPNFRMVKNLAKGTERGFSCMQFDPDGTSLASVGQAPDFLLTVWDWHREKIVLHCKAFGQEIFNVQFSPEREGFLNTSGTGHIRFWKMANTFTGLKLQGDIGKFGKIDLSDIAAFWELPDGKVLSGTETGYLLLWEGNFIKCRFLNQEGGPAHNGPIHVIKFQEEHSQFLTGGDDGWLRLWDYYAIERAEIDADVSMDYEISPTKEIFVGEGIKVFAVERSLDGSHYLIIDGNGSLIKLNLYGASKDQLAEPLLNFHSGPIRGMDASPRDHFCATASEDGSVRCWDYVGKQMLFAQHFNSAATCLQWAPVTVDPKVRTIAVGFNNGTLRVLYRGEKEWIRLQALKPHNVRITTLSYSSSGTMIATGSNDMHIFLLRTSPSLSKAPYEPILFVKTDTEITGLSWRSDSKAVIFGCTTGQVGEIDFSLPGALDQDTSDSYHVEMPIRWFNFKKPKTLKRSESDGTEGTKGDGDDHTQTTIGGEDKTRASNEDDEEEEEEEENDIVPPALQVCYKYNVFDRFLITFGGKYGGMIYECHWDEEYPIAEFPLGEGPRAQQKEGACLPSSVFLQYDRDARFMMTGDNDGTVTLRTVSEPESFIRLLCHDGDCSVWACQLSYDASFLLTAGGDGILQCYKFNAEGFESDARQSLMQVHRTDEEIEERTAPFHMIAIEDGGEYPTGMDRRIKSSVQTDQPPPGEVAGVEVLDIGDDNVYSIEDEKLKKEEDARQTAAERKKDIVRQVILELQKEFKTLYELNEKQPEEKQLDPEEFLIDPEYHEMLQVQGQEIMEEVHREMEYETEMSDIRLKKLHDRFIEPAEMERLTLNAFRSGYFVRSFRTRKLPIDMQLELMEIHEQLKLGEIERAKAAKVTGVQNGGAADDKNRGSALDGSRFQAGGYHTRQMTGQDSGEGHQKVSTFEIRKAARQIRKAHLAHLLAKKPAADAEDVNDVMAIQYAEANMGDFKLKSSADYEVPEDQQINAEKKRRQMLLLEESTHAIKMRFNKRFLQLREVKLNLIREIEKDNERIKDIDKKLKEIEPGHVTSSDDLWQPKINSTEWRDKRDKFNEKELLAFGVELETKDVLSVKPPPQTFVPDEKQAKIMMEEEKPPETEEEKIEKAIVHTKELTADAIETLPAWELSTQPTIVQHPDLQREENERSWVVLGAERADLLQRRKEKVQTFDDALFELRSERAKTTADLKAADLRMLVLYQELELLQNFESKDQALTSKLEKAKVDKQAVRTSISDCQAKLSAKKAEIEVWEDQASSIQKEFYSLCPETHQFHQQLLKIFKRKVKKSKKRQLGADDDEDEDEEEDWTDSDDDFDSDMDDDEEEVDDSCPAGCDMALFEQVLELRDKRCEKEEKLQEFQKNVDELKRNHERHMQREKQIDKELKNTEKEIRSFQTEKLARLNQLDVVIALKLNQLYCMEGQMGMVELQQAGEQSVESADDQEGQDDAAPMAQGPCKLITEASMETHVVFTRNGLKQLDNRIIELGQETDDQRHELKKLYKDKGYLKKDTINFDAQIQTSKTKCEELQMLKFGQLIDLEKLDKHSASKGEEELQAKLNLMEKQYRKELGHVEKDQRDLKERLLSVTHENTTLLSQIAELGSKQFQLEKELNTSGGGVAVADKGPTIRKEIEERNRLVSLVKLQAKELEAIKAEINLLRRKGGHIYAPAAQPVNEAPPAPVQDDFQPPIDGSNIQFS